MALVVTGSGRRRDGAGLLIAAAFAACQSASYWRVRAVSVSARAAPAGGLRGCGASSQVTSCLPSPGWAGRSAGLDASGNEHEEEARTSQVARSGSSLAMRADSAICGRGKQKPMTYQQNSSSSPPGRTSQPRTRTSPYSDAERTARAWVRGACRSLACCISRAMRLGETGCQRTVSPFSRSRIRHWSGSRSAGRSARAPPRRQAVSVCSRRSRVFAGRWGGPGAPRLPSAGWSGPGILCRFVRWPRGSGLLARPCRA
jgi:hypothetical protein